jgi:hypothetical protein
MGIEEQHMLRLAQPVERPPQQWTAREVEGLVRRLLQPPVKFLRRPPAQVNHRQRHRHLRQDHLHRPGVGVAEHRPQHLVAPHDLLQRTLQGDRPHGAVQHERPGHVVSSGGALLQPIKKP